MKKIGTKLILYISILLLVFGSIIGFIVMRDVRTTISLVVTEKVLSDLNSSCEIVDFMYPGEWKVDNNSLYKGGTLINDNNRLVDKIGELTGYAITIFLGDTRVATNIEMEGVRAVGTQAAPNVVEEVLSKGQEYIGEADVLNERYQTIYRPIQDDKGNNIGMFFVGAPKAFEDGVVRGFISRFLLVLIAGLILSILAANIIGRSIASPINAITLMAGKIANLDISMDVPERSTNREDEIGQLARAFQSVTTGLRNIVREIQDTSEKVAATSEELAAISEESTAAAQQVATSAGEVAVHIKDQIIEVEKSTSAIEEINISIEEVSKNVESIENISREAFEKSNMGKECISIRKTGLSVEA